MDRVFLYVMPRGQVTKDIIKCEILKLKHQLYEENSSEDVNFLAQKYLNKVLDKLDEYSY